jgi:hypothetical protein
MPAGALQVMRELQDAVRRYLQVHADAADTPTGIRQWWLPDRLRSTSLELVRLALEEMVANGELRYDTLLDSTRLYSLPERVPPAQDPH